MTTLSLTALRVPLGALAVIVALASCRASPRGAAASAADIRVDHAVAWGLPAGGVGTVGLRITNVGGRADTLIDATSPDAAVTMHDVQSTGGSARMVAISEIALLPGQSVVLGTGRQHLMLDRVDPAVWRRAQITVVLRFRHGLTLTLAVPVLRVSEALDVLRGG